MANKSPDYNFSEIERTWQQYWDEHQTFAASEDTDKEKFYALKLFKRGLAFVDERPVWWREALGTVLAIEFPIIYKNKSSKL